jgi:hypothetical protein
MARTRAAADGTKLPKGLERKRGRLVVDANLTAVRLGPGLIVFGKTPLRAAQRLDDGFAWASCTCDKDGACKVTLKTLPGGSKAEVVCESGTCKGSCTAHAGEIPRTSARLSKSIVEVLQPVAPKR